MKINHLATLVGAMFTPGAELVLKLTSDSFLRDLHRAIFKAKQIFGCKQTLPRRRKSFDFGRSVRSALFNIC
jgi:hypothetical protein